MLESRNSARRVEQFEIRWPAGKTCRTDDAAFTLGRGRNKIRAFEAGQASKLVIQNNVPYASKLAEGHSFQADAGWIDEAIDLALLFPPGTEELP